jgi:hypothetical protein
MRTLLTAMLVFILSSCSGVQMPHESVERHVASQVVTREGEENYWWHASFKISWPEADSAPNFSNDLIIVNEVIAPVLAVHTDDIKLWRFHRRAGRDAAGHQFSFIFYGTPETAGGIFNQLKQNPLLAELVDSNILLEVKLDDPTKPGKKEIADASDPSWPPSLQRSWPYFIMGVSVMYMDLVEQEVDQERMKKISSVTARLNDYRAANDRLTVLWKEQGQHAFFHHIGGIFGYETVEVQF